MSELSLHKVNTSYKIEFMALDATGAAKTGATTGNFAVAVFKDGVYQASPPSATFAELSSSHAPGIYTMTITPNATGRWFFYITNSDGWLDLGVQDSVKVFNNDLDSIVGSMMLEPLASWESNGSFDYHSLGMLIAVLCNKAAISGSTLTIYKTDGTTPLKTFAVSFDPTQGPIQSSTP